MRDAWLAVGAVELLLFLLVPAAGFDRLPRRVKAHRPLGLPGPYKIFQTEPSIVPTIVNVTYTTDDVGALADGYDFVAPHAGHRGWGPQILDRNGDLVWYGEFVVESRDDGRPYFASNFRVCDYLGSRGKHLCFGEHGDVFGMTMRILDASYNEVERIRKIGNLSAPNNHEFNVLSGGYTYLQAIYQKRHMDLRKLGGWEKGWISDGCIQEIDILSRSVLFQWCAMDHLSIWESYLYLNVTGNKQNASSQVSGFGRFYSPWDFMHLNSVDKNSEGDYLLSSRHLFALIKIAGNNNNKGLRPGTPIWRLGGKHSDFKFKSRERDGFSLQHHARFISTSPTEEVISLFDNHHLPTKDPENARSRGLVLRLNNKTMEVTVERSIPTPDKEHPISNAQGSMFLLPNGNAKIGWGANPWWSEHSPNGTLLHLVRAYAEAGPDFPKDNGPPISNYRAFTFPWIGKPQTRPKVLAYCRTCAAFLGGKDSSPFIVYVSWNGATEVKSWRLFLNTRNPFNPWLDAGTFPKRGFETVIELNALSISKHTSRWLDNFPTYVSVEAIDSHGAVLAKTQSKTFVPNPHLRKRCGKRMCHKPARFVYVNSDSRAFRCNFTIKFAFVSIILSVVVIEYVSFCYTNGFAVFGNLGYSVPRHLKEQQPEYEADGLLQQPEQHAEQEPHSLTGGHR